MKLRKRKLLAVCLCLSMLLCSCGDGTASSKKTDNKKKKDVKTQIKELKQNDKQTKKLQDSGIVRNAQRKLKGDGKDKVTILVYMNGSNLETESGEATTDLSEMVAAGNCDNVQIVVQTMGTKKWDKKYGIADDRSQIYSVNGDGLKLVKDDLGQLDCTKASTLTSFIKWGKANYPADRYMLLFWDHGGGPVYGFGYDDNNADSDASMSIAEMTKGIADAGVFFDIIGMDCCIMASLEVGCALYNYCDYSILSEDFESGLGWSYTPWLKKLYKNTSIKTLDLGKSICDSMVDANENDSEWGDKSIMAVVDESMMKLLYAAWTEFAYANENELLNKNYSKQIQRKKGGRILPKMDKKDCDTCDNWDYNWDYESNAGNDVDEQPNMADYFVTDMMAVAQNISSDKSDALSAAMNQALPYVKTSSGEDGLTGLSVTLPYGGKDFYSKMKSVFESIGFDNTYIQWLDKFTSVAGNTESYDYDDWNSEWDWQDYDDDYDWEDWDYYDDDEYWDESDECSWCKEENYIDNDCSDGNCDDGYDDSDDGYDYDDSYDDYGYDDSYNDYGYDDSYDSYDYDDSYDDDGYDDSYDDYGYDDYYDN